MRNSHPPLHVLALLVLVFTGTASAQDSSLQSTLDRLVGNGGLVAAQAVVGRRDQILIDHAVGVTIPGGDLAVDSDTLFCIGSCSKPFASAVVMLLVENGKLDLEKPISRYLPAFENLKLTTGEPSKRAPTMKELLAHRSGIYSQKKGMTSRQAGWIRNFGLTLEESVQGIAGEPLIGKPGTEYAYSGAGYCVAGRVAELAAGTSFENLIQSKIAAPVKLKRTTYFPDPADKNVAAGGVGGMVNPATPHLTKPRLRFPLIGGSLYSTARETARFLRMTAQRGRIGIDQVMKRKTWKTWTSRPYAEGSYGFGWALSGRTSSDEPAAVSHSGALASSRSNMVVIPKTGAYAVVHYTVASRDDEIGSKIRTAVRNAIEMEGPDR